MTLVCGGLPHHLSAQNKKARYVRPPQKSRKNKKAVQAVKKNQRNNLLKHIDKATVSVYNKAMENAGGQLVDGGLDAAKASSLLRYMEV